MQTAEVSKMFQGPKIPLRVSFSNGAFNIRSRFLSATIARCAAANVYLFWWIPPKAIINY